MADDIDRANDLAEQLNRSALAAADRAIPPGNAGVCEECGEFFVRIVNGHCARCREDLGLG